MVSSGQDRADKYASKFDPTVVSSRYTAGKDAATRKAQEHQIAMGTLATQVRGILDAAGVAPINSIRFIGYANKLYSISLKFGGVTGKNEAIEASTAWITKIAATTADKTVLSQIWNLFSDSFGQAPSPFPA